MALNSLVKQAQHFNDSVEEADKLSSELPTIADSPDVWLTGDAVTKQLRPSLNYSTSTTLCKRLHAGLVRARCRQFMIDDKVWRRDSVIPKGFWWAEGEAALKCNWVTGDFETWIDNKFQLRAFGVTVYRPDIDTMMPAAAAAPEKTDQPHGGGRPAAKFWDDLWVEMCRQIYEGKLIPTSQADIQKAMQQWCSDNGHSDAASTIKPRASKLWNAVFAAHDK